MDNVKNVSTLSRLFSTVGENQPAPQPQKAETSKPAVDPRGSEAVKLAADFGAESASPEEAKGRAERVQLIKNQVESGTYNPDMKSVAESVIKDLLL